jgi:hypothetical protein
MSTPQSVAAPSLAEAIAIVDAEPAYQFRNQWLVDVDARIKGFTYDAQSYIAKCSSPQKGDQEIARAQKADHLLMGACIGSRAVAAVVPKAIPLDGSRHYLVSEYLGSDMNEQHYQRIPSLLSGEEWGSLIQLLMSRGIIYDGLLPRNTIVTQDQISLIDWEGARFSEPPAPPDRLTRTGLNISWSYFYGMRAASEIQDLPLDAALEPKPIGYEKAFSGLIGHKGEAGTLRMQACATAVAAEADRSYGRLLYKLDDAFHLIGELTPSIEVVMDMLLARRDDASHYAAAQLIALTAKSLHEAAAVGQSAASVNTFKRRCANLAWVLASENIPPITAADHSNICSVLPEIDAIAPPSEAGDIAQQLRRAIIQSYPSARPQDTALISLANSIRGLASL